MRRLLLILFLACLAPAAARPDEAAGLKDRVLKAAAKDPADLKKLRVLTVKAKGLAKPVSEPIPATFEMTGVYPAQIKLTWEFGTGAMKTVATLCATNDRGWKASNFASADLGLEEINDFRTDAYAVWVATLITLDDRETKLSLAGRSRVGPAAVVGLKVARRPWPDITLWFDETSNLLRKMTYRSRDAGAVLNKEMTYDGHKEVSGLMVPTKHTITIQGREVYNWTEMEYAFPEKIDPKMFDKP